MIGAGFMIRAVVLGVALSAATAAYFGWRAHQRDIGAQEQRLVDQAEADRLREQASSLLATERARVSAAETKLRELKEAQDVTDANNQKRVAKLAASLRQLTNAAGQLRDPYARSGGCGGGSDSAAIEVASAPHSGGGDPASAAGLLSPELTGFLQRKDEEADAINLAYIACRATAVGDRATLH